MIKLTYDYVKKYIELIEGYKLISSCYKNSYTKLKIQCSKNHIFEMKYANFYSGQRCGICSRNNRFLIFENVKKYIESFDGYKLISTKYSSAKEKLQIKCPKNHIFNMSYDTFSHGYRCFECFGKKKHTYKNVKKYIESFDGYKLLSNEYINNNTKLIN